MKSDDTRQTRDVMRNGWFCCGSQVISRPMLASLKIVMSGNWGLALEGTFGSHMQRGTFTVGAGAISVGLSLAGFPVSAFNVTEPPVFDGFKASTL